MKSTSASVYGNRPSPGGVAWSPCAGAPAHAAVAAARSRDATLVARDRMAPATVWKRNAPMGADYRSGAASFELLYLRSTSCVRRVESPGWCKRAECSSYYGWREHWRARVHRTAAVSAGFNEGRHGDQAKRHTAVRQRAV